MAKTPIPPPGRKAALDRRRLLKMAESAHAYVRGNTVVFYEWLQGGAVPRTLPEGPSVWICGDCHTGNLGPVADQDGKVDIQIRDVDQTVIGNPAHDLLRLGLSLAMAARSSDLPGLTTALMIEALIDGYREALSGRKPRVRSHQIAPIGKVMQNALKRKWRHLAEERIEDVTPHIPLGSKFWPLLAAERRELKRLFKSEAQRELLRCLTRGEKEDSVALADAAYWVKGCSSLGRLRYAVLVRAGKNKHRLIDVKEAGKAAAPCAKNAPMPGNHAERVVTGARHLSPYLGERMVAAKIAEHPVVVRELRPQDIKFELSIMRVQKGEITAAEGARLLGVSRKTYYPWEKRGLSGLLSGVSELEPGRPSPQIDPEKEALQRKVVELEAALNQAKEVEAVRLVLLDMAKIRDRKERSKKTRNAPTPPDHEPRDPTENRPEGAATGAAPRRAAYHLAAAAVGSKNGDSLLHQPGPKKLGPLLWLRSPWRSPR